MNVYYTGKGDSAILFVNEMISTSTVDKIRAEDGNLRYDYFVKIDEPQTVLLIDEWQSQEALDVHHASPMMGVIAKLRDKYDLHIRVERFLSDEANEADKNYIRE